MAEGWHGRTADYRDFGAPRGGAYGWLRDELDWSRQYAKDPPLVLGPQDKIHLPGTLCIVKKNDGTAGSEYYGERVRLIEAFDASKTTTFPLPVIGSASSTKQRGWKANWKVQLWNATTMNENILPMGFNEEFGELDCHYHENIKVRGAAKYNSSNTATGSLKMLANLGFSLTDSVMVVSWGKQMSEQVVVIHHDVGKKYVFYDLIQCPQHTVGEVSDQFEPPYVKKPPYISCNAKPYLKYARRNFAPYNEDVRNTVFAEQGFAAYHFTAKLELLDAEKEWHFEPNQAPSSSFDANSATPVGTTSAVRGGKLFVKMPKVNGGPPNQDPTAVGYRFYSKTSSTALAFNLWPDRTKNTNVYAVTK